MRGGRWAQATLTGHGRAVPSPLGLVTISKKITEGDLRPQLCHLDEMGMTTVSTPQGCGETRTGHQGKRILSIQQVLAAVAAAGGGCSLGGRPGDTQTAFPCGRVKTVFVRPLAGPEEAPTLWVSF